MEDGVITDSISEVAFRVYGQQEIQKLSVKELTNPQLFDNLELPTIGGLYDPALGSTRNNEECSSCGHSGLYCPGHMGHINLTLPVFNPVFFKTLFKILQGACLSCLFMPEVEGVVFVHRMTLLEHGCVVGSNTLQDFVWQFQADKGEHADTFQQELLTKLDQLAKKFLKDGSDGTTICTKMADSSISQLVDAALKRYFNTPKVCPHCLTKTVTLRQEYSSRISARSSGDRRSRVPKKVAKSARKPAPAPIVPQEPEEDVYMVDQSEEWEEVDSLLEKGKGQCLIMPHLAQQILRKVWHKNGKVLGKVFSCLGEISDTQHPTDMFFLTTLLVPPSRYRPVSVMGDRKFENPQTANFSRVLTNNYEIRQLLANMNIDLNKSADLATLEGGNQPMEEVQTKWIQLQTHINCLMDSDLDKLSAEGSKLQGIRQLLEKKEGLFRMHMMGKRVNYAARSVISPDLCINTNEIGVPTVFAKKLTYPHPVTPWNVHELRQNVINGPDTYPGASAVVNEDGSVTKLSSKSQTQREAVAKQLLTPSDTSASAGNRLPKQVLRHLKDGDVMLLNRQPTLHRPSIQAHRTRVLHGLKTLRLHYSNCKAYNADFDGDEMNAHFPQSELCRAEAYSIASTDFQYLVPKDGTPLGGLIQDHMVAGVALTVRGRFFSRHDFYGLLQSALAVRHSKLRTLPPAILKPCPMWSGKQVISALLLNVIPRGKPPLSLEGKAKIDERSWISRQGQRLKPYMTLAQAQKDTEELGESTVLVDHGELLQGVLDKSQCGPTPYGLVHCVYELYGGEVAGQLLTCLGRLFTACLKLKGFTLGVEDILTRDEAESRRDNFVVESSKVGHKVVQAAFDRSEDCDDSELLQLLKAAQFGKDDIMKHLDMCAKTTTNEVAEKSSVTNVKKDLSKSFPDNNLQLMEQAGAKGAAANTIQMSSMLGQIELEGRRPPLMKSGQSAPSHGAYDLNLRAGGFVTARFLTSIPTQDFSFHCMAGREGLIDTAVKTSRSGYLQRCLVKHLEGLMVSYDMTVRDSDASVIQFVYGEDGLEVCKTRFLEEKQLPFLLKNQHVVTNHPGEAKEDKRIRKHKKKIEKWQKKQQEKKERASGFLDFCCTKQESQQPVVNGDAHPCENNGRSAKSAVLEVEWRSLNPKQKYKFMKKHQLCPDPVLSRYWPQVHTGVISEKLQKSVNNIQQQLTELGQSAGDSAIAEQSLAECETLTRMVNNKAMMSLCNPGEAVGLICAQSIGEPSTQMTLNTFHFAGRAEMNVTLGIPRLREVLMTASANILTPCVEVPIVDTPEAKAFARKLQQRLSCVFLTDVLEGVNVCGYVQSASPDRRGRKKRFYSIQFSILPRKTYSNKIKMKPADVLTVIENVLIRRISRAAQKVMDKNILVPDLVSQSAKRQVERSEDEGTTPPADDGDSDVELQDGDCMEAKAQARHSDIRDYEGEEEERQEVGDATQPDEEEGEEPESTVPVEDSKENSEEVDEESGKESAAVAMAIDKVEKLDCVHKYRRDEKGKWCEVILQFRADYRQIDMKSLVEREAGKLVLQQMKGIKRCMLIKRTHDTKTGHHGQHLVTEGVNLEEMMKYSNMLDVNALYTNSIADIQNTYGIEAASKAIIKEVQQVFNVYGIKVDYRHLSLLADYMTCEGTYKGFNRSAMSSNPSPLQKVTFETSVTFLVNACTNARPDKLRSPSARIVAGQVVSCGTGAFEIVQPLQV